MGKGGGTELLFNDRSLVLSFRTSCGKGKVDQEHSFEALRETFVPKMHSDGTDFDGDKLKALLGDIRTAMKST